MAQVENPLEKVRRKMVNARIEFLGQLAKFSREELQKHPVIGEWSPLELAYHLYIADGLAIEQMRLIQSEDNPQLPALAKLAPTQTKTADVPDSLEPILAGMAARREEIFQYLTDLPADAWERPFQHEEWGSLKFYQLINVLPQHDQQHSQQLAMMKELMPS